MKINKALYERFSQIAKEEGKDITKVISEAIVIGMNEDRKLRKEITEEQFEKHAKNIKDELEEFKNENGTETLELKVNVVDEKGEIVETI